MILSNEIALVVGAALVAALFLGGPSVPGSVPGGAVAAIAGFLSSSRRPSPSSSSSRPSRYDREIRINQLNDVGWKYLANAALLQVGIVLVMAAWGVAR